jgi:hypothetical protein
MRWFGVALATVACNSVLGVEELPRAAPDAGLVPIQYASADCERCIRDQCGSHERACADDRECRATHACIAACKVNDPRCRTDCESSPLPDAARSKLYALDGCQRLSCFNQCVGGKGIGASMGAGCECLDDPDVGCGNEMLACIKSGSDRKGEVIGACERRWMCLTKALTPSGALRCYYRDRQADLEVDAIRNCLAGSSCSACSAAGGRLYACMNNYRWEKSTVPRVNLTLTIRENTKERLPVNKLRVRACSAEHCASCTEHIAEGFTNELGVVTLDLPIAGGFEGCFEAIPEDTTKHVPMLFYPGHPITTAEDQLNPTVIRRSDIEVLTALMDYDYSLKNRGTLALVTSDCLWTKSSGMTLTVEPRDDVTKVAYLRDGLPVAMGPTDPTGGFAAAGLPVGLVKVRAFRDGKQTNEARVVIRDGFITAMLMFPAPQP